MENEIIYSTFFNAVQESIANGTFAKLTLAKTVGKPELQNIYVRMHVEDNILKTAITFKIYTGEKEEIVKISEVKDIEADLMPHINNPFLSALLFTTEADITMKLNKKRVASIIEQPPTFKNADPVLLEFLG
ncbi:hypothetical protein SY27_15380 [Flavobacterium sp. 316]|uniref:SCP-2 sterol transfer family protein n=1 Tax=Flavobacterium sediminilitoris TaxID=2024526 RepID=A0ABY4HMR7_9FLAO|nr:MULTISPECIES: hypothetical protein [Flavobacterium]KIX19912.1 hypothetical protein SY27_15380 [Flavobacterium sp. 316]UOX33878.1 hypothetical protein LXD69_17825 [Flavobacterium sediminilitoris]